MINEFEITTTNGNERFDVSLEPDFKRIQRDAFSRVKTLIKEGRYKQYGWGKDDCDKLFDALIMSGKLYASKSIRQMVYEYFSKIGLKEGDKSKREMEKEERDEITEQLFTYLNQVIEDGEI